MGDSVNKFRIVTKPDGKRRVFAIGQSVYRGDLD